MPTSNPAWKGSVFIRTQSSSAAMTLKGTLAKISFLFLLLLLSASYTWYRFYVGYDIEMLVITGVIGSLAVAVATIIWPKVSPVTAPLYALIEGLAIGGISATLESQYQGIVIQAAALTFAVLAALLFLYSTGIIKVTKRFRTIVFSATIGILLIYLVNLVLHAFFQTELPYLHSSSPIGIGINLFIAAIAALNLSLDFDFISRGIKKRGPKYLEWYAAFGLMITLVWLYLEILRLLQKLRR